MTRRPCHHARQSPARAPCPRRRGALAGAGPRAAAARHRMATMSGAAGSAAAAAPRRAAGTHAWQARTPPAARTGRRRVTERRVGDGSVETHARVRGCVYCACAQGACGTGPTVPQEKIRSCCKDRHYCVPLVVFDVIGAAGRGSARSRGARYRRTPSLRILTLSQHCRDHAAAAAVVVIVTAVRCQPPPSLPAGERGEEGRRGPVRRAP